MPRARPNRSNTVLIATAFVGGGRAPVGHVEAEPGEEGGEVAGDADGHHGHDGNVFQDQVPADEPADDFPEGHISVGVGGAGAGDHAGELRLGQGRGRGCQPGDQEGDQDGGPDAGFGAAAVGHQACQGEDADADDAADTDCGQLPASEGLVQSAVLVLFLDLADGLSPHDGLLR